MTRRCVGPIEIRDDDTIASVAARYGVPEESAEELMHFARRILAKRKEKTVLQGGSDGQGTIPPT